VGSRHVGDVLSLLRQGITVGVQFGTHSVEALLWVAETVEEGVYEAGSLARSADGVTFVLDNPLLRVGLFTSLKVLIDGTEVPGEHVRLRPGAGTSWRTAGSVGPESGYSFAPGDRTEFDVRGGFGRANAPITVRLELRSPAIPPLVWFEFTESPTVPGAPS
jgi:hypothetical protein